VSHDEFKIRTPGGVVYATVGEHGLSVAVCMGKVRFTHESEGEPPLCPQEIAIDNKRFVYYLANVGNPHCVIIVADNHESLAKGFGGIIENDSRFPERTNVQFVKILSRNSIQIEIWERGAGYTLASGTSSTAAAAVA